MGLDDSVSKTYGSLSGGQKRRVNIALALVGAPEIVFLDEPTTGLDPEYRFRFWEYLRRQNSHGMTVVATTHYMEEAREYCDVVLLMNDGRVAAYGPPPSGSSPTRGWRRESSCRGRPSGPWERTGWRHCRASSTSAQRRLASTSMGMATSSAALRSF